MKLFRAVPPASRPLRPSHRHDGRLSATGQLRTRVGSAAFWPTPPPAPTGLAWDEQVRVVIFGQDQLTGQFRVNDRGNISVPLLGSIPANGLTTSELENSIALRLKEKKILVDPSVSVEVLGYRPVLHPRRGHEARPICVRARHDGPDHRRHRRRLHLPRPDGVYVHPTDREWTCRRGTVSHAERKSFPAMSLPFSSATSERNAQKATRSVKASKF